MTRSTASLDATGIAGLGVASACQCGQTCSCNPCTCNPCTCNPRPSHLEARGAAVASTKPDTQVATLRGIDMDNYKWQFTGSPVEAPTT